MSVSSDKLAHIQVVIIVSMIYRVIFGQVSTDTGHDQLLIFRCTNVHLVRLVLKDYRVYSISRKQTLRE